MIAVTARTILKTYASLAGSGFGAICPLLARQIDVAMPEFGGANRERCVSYVTLRRLSKKCKVAKKPHGKAMIGAGPCWGRKGPSHCGPGQVCIAIKSDPCISADRARRFDTLR